MCKLQQIIQCWQKRGLEGDAASSWTWLKHLLLSPKGRSWELLRLLQTHVFIAFPASRGAVLADLRPVCWMELFCANARGSWVSLEVNGRWLQSCLIRTWLARNPSPADCLVTSSPVQNHHFSSAFLSSYLFLLLSPCPSDLILIPIPCPVKVIWASKSPLKSL